jgi:hypothetical protein
MTAPMDCRLIGRWRIVESDLWDRDHLDLVEPAMINPRPPRMPAHLAQRCPDGHDLPAARRQRLTFQYHDPVVDAPDPPLAAGDVSPCNVVGPRMISGPAAAAAGRSGSVTWLAHVAGPRPPGPGQPAGRRARSARGGSTAHGSRRGRTSLRDLEPWPRSTCTRSCSRGFCPSPMSSTAPDPPAWAMRPCACQRSSTSSCTSSPTAISDILAMLSVGSRCGIAWKPRPCCAGHRRASLARRLEALRDGRTPGSAVEFRAGSGVGRSGAHYRAASSRPFSAGAGHGAVAAGPFGRGRGLARGASLRAQTAPRPTLHARAGRRERSRAGRRRKPRPRWRIAMTRRAPRSQSQRASSQASGDRQRCRLLGCALSQHR